MRSDLMLMVGELRSVIKLFGSMSCLPMVFQGDMLASLENLFYLSSTGTELPVSSATVLEETTSTPLLLIRFPTITTLWVHPVVNAKLSSLTPTSTRPTPCHLPSALLLIVHLKAQLMNIADLHAVFRFAQSLTK